MNNPLLIRKYEYASNYLGRYTDYTDDWCFQVKGNIIKELCIGGTNCYHMYGISYWDAKDGAQMERTWTTFIKCREERKSTGMR